MSTTDKGSTSPSPGALRAAEEIADIFEDTIYKRVTKRSDVIETLANLIDRETGASELLAALEALKLNLSGCKDNYFRAHAAPIINAAIAKAEPPTLDKQEIDE